MTRVRVNYAFQDIHTQAVYEAGSVQEFTAERVVEIHNNLPGFVTELVENESADEVQVEKPKRSRKKKEVTDELPAGETEV